MKIKRNLINLSVIIAMILGMFTAYSSQAASVANSWKSVASMPLSKANFGAAAAPNGKVYIIGGESNWVLSGTVDEYDPLTNTWTAKADMLAPRHNLSVVTAGNGKIYAIGGRISGDATTGATDEYDPLTNTWTAKASMPTPRYCLGVAAVGNKIYAIGGVSATGPYNYFATVEEYDISTNTWTTKASMNTARGYLSATAAGNGKIYSLGGGGPLATVEEYDPSANTWLAKADMITPEQQLSAVAGSSGKIYAIGGGAPGYSSAVQEYDPATNTWTAMTPMPTPRTALDSASASNGMIYAFGGYNNTGYSATVEEYTPPSGNSTTYSVTGRVTLSGSTVGLAGVSVSFTGGMNTLTDVSGIYSIDGLAAGSYTLTPSKTGYSFTPTTRLISVGPGLTEQNFSAAPVTFSISGRIILASAASGLANVTVSDGFGHSILTDANGNYTLNGVPSGAYTLTPSKSGFSFDPPTRSGILVSNLTSQDFTSLANENLVLKVDSGFSSNHLNWEPAQNSAVDAYRIWRATPTSDSAYSEIAIVNGLDYLDSSGLNVSTNYCYKVEAIANSAIVATSTAVCVLFGQINLWVPEMNGMKGNTITVPINIRNANGLSIASADIWLNYDASVLKCVDVTKTAMTVDFQWYANCLIPGKVRISTFASPARAIAGDGSLFWLTFTVQGDTGTSSPLTLVPYTLAVGGSSISTDPGSGIPVDVALALSSSTFHVEDGGMLGDVNNDKTVSGKDAYQALQIAVGKVIPDWRQHYAADVNGDGIINSADVSMILYYAAFASWPQVPAASQQKVNALQGANPAEVSLDSIIGDSGSIVTTTLRAQNLQNWAGGDFVITFNPRLVASVTEVTATGLANSTNLAWYYNGNGSLKISIASNAAINGSGGLATIKLRLAYNPSAPISPLVLAGTRFHDLYGRDFEFSAIQGTINRTSGSVKANYMNFIPVVRR